MEGGRPPDVNSVTSLTVGFSPNFKNFVSTAEGDVLEGRRGHRGASLPET